MPLIIFLLLKIDRFNEWLDHVPLIYENILLIENKTQMKCSFSKCTISTWIDEDNDKYRRINSMLYRRI